MPVLRPPSAGQARRAQVATVATPRPPLPPQRPYSARGPRTLGPQRSAAASPDDPYPARFRPKGPPQRPASAGQRPQLRAPVAAAAAAAPGAAAAAQAPEPPVVPRLPSPWARPPARAGTEPVPPAEPEQAPPGENFFWEDDLAFEDDYTALSLTPKLISEDAVPELWRLCRVGDEVLCRYKRTIRWFPATVVRVWNDGSVKIAWQDDEVQDTLKEQEDLQLRVREEELEEKQMQPYRVGDRLLAVYKGGPWIPATIRKVNDDGSFLVSWADRDKRDRVKRRFEMNRWRGPEQPRTGKLATRSPACERLFHDARRRAGEKGKRLEEMGFYAPLLFNSGCEAWGG